MNYSTYSKLHSKLSLSGGDLFPKDYALHYLIRLEDDCQSAVETIERITMHSDCKITNTMLKEMAECLTDMTQGVQRLRAEIG